MISDDYLSISAALVINEDPGAGAATSLGDVLHHLELPALEGFLDELTQLECIGPLRRTCRAMRDLADINVRLPRRLRLQLREDGTVAEPLASLGRWGRRGGISLVLQLPAAAPGGVDALLPAAFTQLPEEVRRRVTRVFLRSLAFAPICPSVTGSTVGALAASLPGLRKLDLSDLPSTWTAGAGGEAYAALGALGTLEELELPGVPGLTGVEALAGSLRRLKVRESSQTLTRSAATTLARLTRLEALELIVPRINLGKGPTLRNLLRLLPPATDALLLKLLCLSPVIGHGLDSTFGVCLGCLVSAKLGMQGPKELAALARNELLPCLGPGGRLESLSIDWVLADGWGGTELAPFFELWRRSDQARVGCVILGQRVSAPDLYSALEALGGVGGICINCPDNCGQVHISLQPPPATPASASAPLVDLPPAEEVLRMALQRIAPPGAGGQGGAAGGRPGTAAEEDAGSRMLLVRGPVAAAALEQPSSEAAVAAWAEDLETRARAASGHRSCGGHVATASKPLIRIVHVLPPAAAVLVECSEDQGAEAVAAAVAAAADGSEVARVKASASLNTRRSTPLGRGLGEVLSELWAASSGEGGPSLQQRVEWVMGVKDTLDALPARAQLP